MLTRKRSVILCEVYQNSFFSPLYFHHRFNPSKNWEFCFSSSILKPELIKFRICLKLDESVHLKFYVKVYFGILYIKKILIKKKKWNLGEYFCFKIIFYTCYNKRSNHFELTCPVTSRQSPNSETSLSCSFDHLPGH